MTTALDSTCLGALARRCLKNRVLTSEKEAEILAGLGQHMNAMVGDATAEQAQAAQISLQSHDRDSPSSWAGTPNPDPANPRRVAGDSEVNEVTALPDAEERIFQWSGAVSKAVQVTKLLNASEGPSRHARP